LAEILADGVQAAAKASEKPPNCLLNSENLHPDN
jgi:hypothetical protein